MSVHQQDASVHCIAFTAAGIKCVAPRVHRIGDGRCAFHTTDRDLAARVQANRVRGGKTKRRRAWTRSHLRRRAEKTLSKGIWDE